MYLYPTNSLQPELDLDLVAKPSYGLNQGRVGRVLLYLGAKSLDVDIESLGISHIITSPDSIDELVPGQYSASVSHQELE